MPSERRGIQVFKNSETNKYFYKASCDCKHMVFLFRDKKDDEVFHSECTNCGISLCVEVKGGPARDFDMY